MWLKLKELLTQRKKNKKGKITMWLKLKELLTQRKKTKKELMAYRIKKRTIAIYNEEEIINQKVAFFNKITESIDKFSHLIDEIESSNFLTKNLEMAEGISLNFLYKKVKVSNQLWFRDIWFPKMETYINELQSAKTELKMLQHRFIGTNITLPFVNDEENEIVESNIDEIVEKFKLYKHNLEALLSIEFNVKTFFTKLPFFKEIGDFFKAAILGPINYPIEGNTYHLINNLKTATKEIKITLKQKRLFLKTLISEKDWYYQSEIFKKQDAEFQNWKNQVFSKILQSITTDLQVNFHNLAIKFQIFEKEINNTLSKLLMHEESFDFKTEVNNTINQIIVEATKVLDDCQNIFENWKFNVKFDECNEKQFDMIDLATSKIKKAFDKTTTGLRLLINFLQNAKLSRKWIVSDHFSLASNFTESKLENRWNSPIFQTFFQITTNEIKILTKNFVDFFLNLHPKSPELITQKQINTLDRLYPLQPTGLYQICDVESRIANYDEKSNSDWLKLLFEHLAVQLELKTNVEIEAFANAINQFTSTIMNIWITKSEHNDIQVNINLLVNEMNQILAKTNKLINYLLTSSQQFKNQFIIEADCWKAQESLKLIDYYQTLIDSTILPQMIDLQTIKSKIEYMANHWMIISPDNYIHYQLDNNLVKAFALGNNIEWFFRWWWQEDQFLKLLQTKSEKNDSKLFSTIIQNWIQNESVLPICNLSQQVGEDEQILKNERFFLNKKNMRKFNFWKNNIFPQFFNPFLIEYQNDINQLTNEISQIEENIIGVIQKLQLNTEQIDLHAIQTKIDDARNTIIGLINHADQNFQNWFENIDSNYCHSKQINHIINHIAKFSYNLSESHEKLQRMQIKLYEISRKLASNELRVILSDETESEIFLQNCLAEINHIKHQINSMKTEFIESDLFLSIENPYANITLANNTCQLPDNTALQQLMLDWKGEKQSATTDFATEFTNLNSETIKIAPLQPANLTQNQLTSTNQPFLPLILLFLTSGFIILLIALIIWNYSKSSNQSKKNKACLESQPDIEERTTMIPLEEINQITRHQNQLANKHSAVNLNVLEQNTNFLTLNQ